MNILVEDIKIIEKYQAEMLGVFTLSDLKALFPTDHLNTFYRRIARLEKSGYLQRFTRGIYVTKKFDLQAVSQKICPLSYISFESVLAANMAIGTTPKDYIKAVKIGKRRIYKSPLGTIHHIGIQKDLYFGFNKVNGINMANAEKALLDTLYFHCKGMQTYFDIYSDINISNMDRNRIKKYLSKYKNNKFIHFVTNYLKEK